MSFFTFINSGNLKPTIEYKTFDNSHFIPYGGIILK